MSKRRVIASARKVNITKETCQRTNFYSFRRGREGNISKADKRSEARTRFGVGNRDADHAGLCGAAAAVPVGAVHRK